MKPICVKCRKFYRLHKMGVAVEEGMLGVSRIPSSDSSGWSPYKLWMANLFKCPKCGHEVIHGFGLSPMSEHYQPDYLEIRGRIPPYIFVPDCC